MIRPYALPCNSVIERHFHTRPYATLVLAGGYEEAGDAGRHRVAAGEVLVHAGFSAHCDRILQSDTRVIDLALPADMELPARGILRDPDSIVRLAERCASDAALALADELRPGPAAEMDWPDQLAADLPRGVRIGEWARERGLGRETLSRQFKRLYGVDPARFRAEARARQAWRMIVGCDDPLAAIADASFHADQAHMTRAVKALTGCTPRDWRRASHRFKTG